MENSKLTAVDLFCGVGGLSAGLREVGFSVIGAVDISELAVEGYRANHPETIVWRQNIRSLSPERVMEDLDLSSGELDLLAGCPPCQGFSTMRTLKPLFRTWLWTTNDRPIRSSKVFTRDLVCVL